MTTDINGGNAVPISLKLLWWWLQAACLATQPRPHMKHGKGPTVLFTNKAAGQWLGSWDNAPKGNMLLQAASGSGAQICSNAAFALSLFPPLLRLWVTWTPPRNNFLADQYDKIVTSKQRTVILKKINFLKQTKQKIEQNLWVRKIDLDSNCKETEYKTV